jgi:hypothetical protein
MRKWFVIAFSLLAMAGCKDRDTYKETVASPEPYTNSPTGAATNSRVDVEGHKRPVTETPATSGAGSTNTAAPSSP